MATWLIVLFITTGMGSMLGAGIKIGRKLERLEGSKQGMILSSQVAQTTKNKFLPAKPSQLKGYVSTKYSARIFVDTPSDPPKHSFILEHTALLLDKSKISVKVRVWLKHNNETFTYGARNYHAALVERVVLHHSYLAFKSIMKQIKSDQVAVSTEAICHDWLRLSQRDIAKGCQWVIVEPFEPEFTFENVSSSLLSDESTVDDSAEAHLQRFAQLLPDIARLVATHPVYEGVEVACLQFVDERLPSLLTQRARLSEELPRTESRIAEIRALGKEPTKLIQALADFRSRHTIIKDLLLTSYESISADIARCMTTPSESDTGILERIQEIEQRAQEAVAALSLIEEDLATGNLTVTPRSLLFDTSIPSSPS